MKKIFFFLISTIICLSCCAQSLRTGVKGRVTYITPCIENFIYLCNLGQSEFNNTMKQYHYSDPKYRDSWLSYMASLDNFIVHAVMYFDYNISGNSIVCTLPKDQMYPTTAMSDIYGRLRPHYFRNEDGIDYYAFNYNGHAYGVMIKDNGDDYYVRIDHCGYSDERISELR